MNYFMKRALTTIFIFSALKCMSQHYVPHVAPPSYHSPYNIYGQKHEGYIELKNGKKIEGVFQYAFWEFQLIILS